MLFEDNAVNRLVEALNLFEEVCSSRWFENTSIILFLNKRDIFAGTLLGTRAVPSRGAPGTTMAGPDMRR